MSRIIKFRAWDLESKIMWCHEELAAADPDGVMSFNSIIGGTSHGMAAMQFTGLLDKNGTPIYEGDVVKGFRSVKNRDGRVTGEERFIGSVSYDEWWGAFRRNGVKQYQGLSAELMYGHELEVIGNIYETPELLEAP